MRNRRHRRTQRQVLKFVVASQLGHGSVAVQRRSYVAPGAAETGEQRQVLRVLAGGRK